MGSGLITEIMPMNEAAQAAPSLFFEIREGRISHIDSLTKASIAQADVKTKSLLGQRMTLMAVKEAVVAGVPGFEPR